MGLNSPGVPSNQLPPDEAWLVRKVADLERVVRELAPSIAKSFQPVIDRLTAQDVLMAATIADLATAQGTLATTVTALGVAQGTLATTVSGLATVVTQVVKPQEIYLSTTHALTSTATTVATSTFTVPAGFTSAVVSASARAGATNEHTTGGDDGAGGDSLGIDLHVGSNVGGAGVHVGIDGWGECVALASDVLTGLTPGGTFTVSVVASTSYFTWSGGMYVAISGTILWFR